MKKIGLLGSAASIAGLALMFTPLGGNSENQSISVGEGNVSGNVVGDVEGGVHSNVENNKSSIVMNIRINTNEIVEKLPKEKRKMAEEVSNIAIQLVEASSQKNNNDIKERIVEDLRNIALVSYSVNSSPFIPPKNKVQLLCGGVFKFVYHGKYFKHNSAIGFLVNNDRTKGYVFPGVTRSYESDGRKLEILYLEYSETESAPILHFECN